jgi:sugar phosphate isomerase/epimerase
VKLGYNTNGLAFHGPKDALALIADAGYQSVAITVDHQWLNPYGENAQRKAADMGLLLDRLGLSCVVETGARFLLDPRRKHEPTLVSAEPSARQRRVNFLTHCVDIAVAIDASCVSIWSGTLHDDVPASVVWSRLREGVLRAADYAADHDVSLAFEPEPGMFVERMNQFSQLVEMVAHPALRLTLDVGHVHCMHDGEIDEHIHAWHSLLDNVHIEDMRRGMHEHLRFGEGEIDFPSVLRVLQKVGYEGGVHVELSRHSHMAPTVVAESKLFLDECLMKIGAP